MSGEVQHLLQFLKLVTGLSGYLVLFASRAERLRKVREANGVAVINPLTEGDRGDALINRKLPKELLLRIFSHLDVVTLCRCARVCKYWNVLALDGSNWQKIDLFEFQTVMVGVVVESIARRCGGFLKQLKLTGCRRVQDPAVQTIAQNCPNIEELDLNMCKEITDATCAALGQLCPKLKKVDLGSCELLTDLGLKFLAEGCQQLKYINISWCDRIGEMGIEVLSKRCPKLTSFSASGLTLLPDSAICYLARYCPLLAVIIIRGCIYVHSCLAETYDMSFTSDKRGIGYEVSVVTKSSCCRTCAALGQLCPKLKKVDLGSCELLTDLGLKFLAEGCQQLKYINISWCDRIGEMGIERYLLSGTILSSIGGHHYPIEVLSKRCPKLTSFSASGLTLLPDSAICYLARYCPLLAVIIIRGCINVTDRAVQAIGKHCINLRYICLSMCTHLTDNSLIALAQCQYLQILEVAGCNHLTDYGFQALTKNCHFLDKLDLEECVLITDQTLSHLAAGCPRLERLSLSHCELVTDEGIKALGLADCSSEHLIVLELDNCPLITDSSLDHLLSCHNLQRIDLYDCQLISRDGIKRLKSHLPNLNVHAYFAPNPPTPSADVQRRRRCCVVL
ncbi:unnamed protein product [Notodromas monacha]|uniref:F-box domain-containing protein n=1 Tax=Notodromas monacha TaxID=399045 RepID=A0A7R9BRQ2_9CRUS|nr:unnamed protein product [Notodromas monacha]CAG0919100.1 unnamed protein product [Notodromas monacha]